MNLSEKLEELVVAQTKIQAEVALIISSLGDTTIPLDERWEVYTCLVKDNIFNRNGSYGDGFIDVLGDNMTLYDDFYIERHETCDYIDMYERIMEAGGEYQKRLVQAREENLAEWQEKVLSSGYSSFTYDW